MPNKKINKNRTTVPNGASENTDLSESDDELSKVRNILKNRVVINDDIAPDDVTLDEDEEEIEEEMSKSKSKSKKKKTIHWMKKPFIPPTSTFNEHLPDPPINSELEPIDYFLFMFGNQSFEVLKEQSNLYSVQVDPNRPANISDTEIRQFIGILIMTGIYSFPQQRFYWMNDTRVESIASTMSRDRFLQIKKYLHVVDNSTQLNQNDPNFDRAVKVRPLLNIVKENFRKIPKEEYLCVDEQIIPFKGKSIMKQHLPNKPNRWRYKMFLLSSSKSGICHDFVFDTGKGDEPQRGFCTDIILKLCETIPRMKNYKMYFDNYFTTIPLLVELKKLGIFGSGTIRTNRLPDLTMKEAKVLQREGRGSMDYRITQVDGIELCATRWFDNNVVNCLSTIHGCEPIDSVKRWSSAEKKHIQVEQPKVIKVYNEFMGGVDLIDMLISFYRINIRSKKYYIKIIFHLIDLSIANAWLLYRRYCSQFRVNKSDVLSLLQFRAKIAEALLKPIVPKRPAQRGRPSLQLRSRQNNSSNNIRTIYVQLPSNSIRLDGFHHWPMATTKGRCRHIGCNIMLRLFCEKNF